MKNQLEESSPLTAVETTGERQHFHVAEVPKLPEFDYWTEHSLRHAIYNASPKYSSSGETIPGNGLLESGAIIRIGRKILIDIVRFRIWIEQHRDLGKLKALLCILTTFFFDNGSVV